MYVCMHGYYRYVVIKICKKEFIRHSNMLAIRIKRTFNYVDKVSVNAMLDLLLRSGYTSVGVECQTDKHSSNENASMSYLSLPRKGECSKQQLRMAQSYALGKWA
jgi:hypothetical protein